MFKLKTDTELNFDSRQMEKTYFEQNQASYPGPGYYHNGYGGYEGQSHAGYVNGTPPPEAHYRGNYHMQGTNSGPQGSGHYGPLDYSQHAYNPQCNMPPNVSPTIGVHSQPMIHPADPSMLKGHHPHGVGPQGAGHHPGAQLGMQGQEIYPWMKEHRQQTKRTHQQTSPGEY